MTQALTLPGIDSTPTPTKRKVGRPSKPAHAKRNRVVKVSLTEAEYEAVLVQAAALRVPPAVLLYQRAFTDRVPAVPAA